MEKFYNIKFYIREGIYTSVDYKTREDAINSLSDVHDSKLVKKCEKIECVLTETELIKISDV